MPAGREPQPQADELVLNLAMSVESARALYGMLKTLQGIADHLGNTQLAYNAHTLAIELKKGIDGLLQKKERKDPRDV